MFPLIYARRFESGYCFDNAVTPWNFMPWSGNDRVVTGKDDVLEFHRESIRPRYHTMEGRPSCFGAMCNELPVFLGAYGNERADQFPPAQSAKQ